jgi:transcriptional/translational regulatory protein YebC/TACO1
MSCSARFAPVKFMFTRKGCVRVCLEKGSDAGSIDEVLDAALESGAEDFEQVPSDQGAVEMEVSLQSLSIELKINMRIPIVRLPAKCLVQSYDGCDRVAFL